LRSLSSSAITGGVDLVFATHDLQQATAARALGFAVVDA
jgi:hypothetical protein